MQKGCVGISKGCRVYIYIYSLIQGYKRIWDNIGLYIYLYIGTYIHGTKVSTYGGLLRSLQYRGEAERAQVSFYLASVAE